MESKTGLSERRSRCFSLSWGGWLAIQLSFRRARRQWSAVLVEAPDLEAPRDVDVAIVDRKRRRHDIARDRLGRRFTRSVAEHRRAVRLRGVDEEVASIGRDRRGRDFEGEDDALLLCGRLV